MILATGPVAPVAEELLGEIVVAGPGEIEALLPQAEVLIARGGVFVSAETIAAAPHLRVIARSGVGFSEVDVEAATRRGIPIVLAPVAGAQAVAEGALALLLALAKQLPHLDRVVKEGRWAERDSILQQSDGEDFARDLHATFNTVKRPPGYGRIDHDWMFDDPELFVAHLEALGLQVLSKSVA